MTVDGFMEHDETYVCSSGGYTVSNELSRAVRASYAWVVDAAETQR